ncbi:biotin--[acetyl-CoA-carboxylase] ligase [Facklamia languida]
MFLLHQFRGQLIPAWQALKVHYQAEVASTNDLAKDYLADDPKAPGLFVSHHQTKGRGRYGKSFYSQLRHGLYFSLAMPIQSEPAYSIDQMTLVTASALVEAFSPYLEGALAIKWVNDLFYQQRKVAGILTEGVLDSSTWAIKGLVVGVGLNLAGSFSQADPSLQALAGTFFGQTLPDSFKQEEWLAQFLNLLHNLLRGNHEPDYLTIYRSHLMGVGQVITYQDAHQTSRGILRGINDQGHLLIQKPDQSIQSLTSGQIHLGSQQFRNL